MSIFVEEAKTLSPQLATAAHDTERAGVVAAQVVTQLRDQGLLNLLSPKIHSGAETDFLTAFNVARELAKGCMSTAWITTVANVHNWMATGFSEVGQNEYFANEQVFAAASFAPTGSAKMVTDGFVANGTWGFLSGVDHADWVFVAARVTDSIDERPTGPWFLMVPSTEIQRLDDSWQVAGLSGSGSKSIVLDNLHVPIHRAAYLPALRQGEGPGAGLHSGALYQAPFFPALLVVLAAPILGATEGALENFIRYTKSRVVKMTGGQQAEQASSQIVVAEVAATIHAAALILIDIVARVDGPTPRSTMDHADIARDTAYAVRALNNAMQQIISNAGGSSAQLDNPIQRAWRDVQVASNHAALNFSTNMQTWGAAALIEW